MAKFTEKDLNYEPHYNSRYIKHLESLAVDKNPANQKNAQLAIFSLISILDIKEYNEKVKAAIRTQNK